MMFTAEVCPWTRFSLADILVLAGTPGAGTMTPPTSTRVCSGHLKCVQGHGSPVNMFSLLAWVGTGKLSAHLEYVLSYGNDVHQHNISTNRRRSGDQTDEVSQYESITL